MLDPTQLTAALAFRETLGWPADSLLAEPEVPHPQLFRVLNACAKVAPLCIWSVAARHAVQQQAVPDSATPTRALLDASLPRGAELWWGPDGGFGVHVPSPSGGLPTRIEVEALLLAPLSAVECAGAGVVTPAWPGGQEGLFIQGAVLRTMPAFGVWWACGVSQDALARDIAAQPAPEGASAGSAAALATLSVGLGAWALGGLWARQSRIVETVEVCGRDGTVWWSCVPGELESPGGSSRRPS